MRGTLQERAAVVGHTIDVRAKGTRGRGVHKRSPYRVTCSCGWWTNTEGKRDATLSANEHARLVIEWRPTGGG